MIINNFEILEKFIPEDHDLFLYGQIMIRKKDSMLCKSNNIVLRDLFIKNKDDLYKQLPIIKKLCKDFTARAYLNPNPRSYKKIAVDIAGLCLDRVRNSSEHGCTRVVSSACGQYTPNRIWVSDIDDINIIRHVIDYFKTIDIKFTKVPTPNGVHLLHEGFDTRVYRKHFPSIEIHKNNPTILYYQEPQELYEQEIIRRMRAAAERKKPNHTNDTLG